MVQTSHKRVKIALIICAVIAVLLVGAVAFAGNFLVDFALNPHASFTMNSMMRGGDVDGLETVTPAKDTDCSAEARTWFDEHKQSISHTAEDGTELLGWEIPADAAAADGGAAEEVQALCYPRETVGEHTYAVVCHGYVGKPADMAKYAYHFWQMGMTVVMPAARGHERNVDAGLIQMGWQDSADLVGWVRDIVMRDPEAKIMLFGVSMGGAEVMMASGRNLPDNVCLIVEDCGYSSVWDEFSLQLDNVFGLPSFPLLNAADLACQIRAGYGFVEASATDMLAQTSVPMLFIHGDADAFVPFSMLDVNYNACASTVKEKLVIENAGHGQASSTDPALYWDTVDGFIAAHMA